MWWTIPTQTKFAGHTLLGHYLYDMEGVAPQPVTLVEKGVLKSFLLTRTPVFKDYPGSNGHARHVRLIRRRGAGVRQFVYPRVPDHARGRHETKADRYVQASKTSPTESWSASWIFRRRRRWMNCGRLVQAFGRIARGDRRRCWCTRFTRMGEKNWCGACDSTGSRRAHSKISRRLRTRTMSSI